MRAQSQFLARAAARLQTPLLLLFAASLLFASPPGTGVGFVAGLGVALALIVHALVFGAAAARAALSPVLGRAALGLGLVGVMLGAGAPRLVFAAQISEAGLFILSVGAASLTIAALAGRAPSLRDEDW